MRTLHRTGFGLGLVGWDYCRRRRNARQADEIDS
jgi:hypothetical protein